MHSNNVLFSQDYWQQFNIIELDTEFIYNFLLEKETPMSTEAIVVSMLENRIALEKERIPNESLNKEKIYKPADLFSVEDTIIFPSMNWKSGKVIQERHGINPEFSSLHVIQVEFENGETAFFASGCENHALNSNDFQIKSEDVTAENVFREHGKALIDKAEKYLASNKDFVRIAGNWFPRSLVVDVHIGHLNLIEAILEEHKGGPLPTQTLLQQVDFQSSSNKKLLEFSFNLALQEDARFDEVGPSGETLWYLKSLEPDDVKKLPDLLSQTTPSSQSEDVINLLHQFEGTINDELESSWVDSYKNDTLSISLIYPHWRCGTLPLSKQLKNLFPTAYESARIRFDFIDVDTNQRFQGWVVRENNYVSGLKDWYLKHDLIPGSLVSVSRGNNPGEIFIQARKSRQNKEWLKTILIGTDQALVFAILKQPVSVEFNDRMVFMVTDADALDAVRASIKSRKESINRTILRIFRELSKLNPQGHVHAQELYGALNLVVRIPPSAVLERLLEEPRISHLGDLYFRLNDSFEENST